MIPLLEQREAAPRARARLHLRPVRGGGCLRRRCRLRLRLRLLNLTDGLIGRGGGEVGLLGHYVQGAGVAEVEVARAAAPSRHALLEPLAAAFCERSMGVSDEAVRRVARRVVGRVTAGVWAGASVWQD